MILRHRFMILRHSFMILRHRFMILRHRIKNISRNGIVFQSNKNCFSVEIMPILCLHDMKKGLKAFVLSPSSLCSVHYSAKHVSLERLLLTTVDRFHDMPLAVYVGTVHVVGSHCIVELVVGCSLFLFGLCPLAQLTIGEMFLG